MCGFQAEDGIRDLVRSRGLGDVYKRQAMEALAPRPLQTVKRLKKKIPAKVTGEAGTEVTAVSYTHLTLPTSDLV